MQEIEIEFKNLLTQEEYERLAAHYIKDSSQIKQQVNYYFETDDFELRSKRAALRIREKNGEYIATLKQPVENGLLETHDIVTEQQFNDWLKDDISLPSNIKKQLDEIGVTGDQLSYKGVLQTNRFEEKYDQYIIVLDHSQYNQTEDYELELEAYDYEFGKQLFSELLDKFQIEKRETPNKIARFFASVKN
ncbi:CYTH domain-containing protein [Alkalibacillus haloalkaliphilus]|uniref:Putative triphosphatase YjbK n=1 Tax=Alkalibacillus haloalkaliphilus TaxID=94136 RepID=A0A511W6E3_9BACI|nr:CYTH domain-containing protein [Alkalibacillus haloalkaliphilus]GEN45633.1 putative triphosphatase YjbK [Alkalibacillus haloalkaliphilus]